MKKILFISDIHIANYNTHAQVIENDMTNRLLLFKTLADDIAQYAANNNVNIIVLGGDLLDRATPTPEELSVAQYFLHKLANVEAPKKGRSKPQNIDLLIINGNHDLSVKKESYSSYNSIVSPIVPQQDNVHYVELSSKLEVQGVTFDCHSWRLPNSLQYSNADVFVGHGAIVGSSSSDGFIFEHGFKHEELAQNYKLALCGDIHKPKLFSESGFYAIQSGTLMQNEFGDDEQAGMWLVELDKTEDNCTVQEPQFIHNQQLAHGAEYYQFITLPVGDEVPADVQLNRPTRIQPEKKSRLKVAGIANNANMVSLQERFAKVVAANNMSDKLVQLFDKLYQQGGAGYSRTPTGAKLQKISINNFRSVDNFTYEFPDVPSMLILGKTGSGKTTLLSAVFFALTGSISKHDTPLLADLPNAVIGTTQPLLVELEFICKEKQYKIIRTYSKKDSELSLMYVDESNEWQQLRRESKKATQECIYDLLGVTEEELFSFCYHSARGNLSFVDLKNADRYAIISKLAQMDKIDGMRDNLKQLSSDCSIARNRLDGAISELQRQVQACSSNITNIMQASAVANIDVAALQKSELEWAAYVEQLVNARNISQLAQSEIANLSSQHSSLLARQQMLAQQRENLIKQYKQNQQQITAINSATCYACNQRHTPADAQQQLQQLTAANDAIVLQGQDIAKQIKDVEQQANLINVDLQNKQAGFTPFDNQQLINAQQQLDQIRGTLQQNAALVEQMAQLELWKQRQAEAQAAILAKAPEEEQITEEALLYKEMGQLLDKKSPFVGALLQIACDSINDELAYIMDGLHDYVLRLNMNKEIDIVADIKGRKNVSLSTLSAGETKIAQIALLVSFVNVYSNMYGLEGGLLGYVFLDEIFSFLDAGTLELAKPLVDKCVARQVVVTHEATLQVKYQHKLLVDYIGGISKYISC